MGNFNNLFYAGLLKNPSLRLSGYMSCCRMRDRTKESPWQLLLTEIRGEREWNKTGNEMTGFSIWQRCLPAIGPIAAHSSHAEASTAPFWVPSSRSLGRQSFWEADVPARPFRLTAVLWWTWAPALHTEYHSVSRVVSFPGPTSYSASTFYVPGFSFPFPANSSIPESSVFNDALSQSPALPNYPIFQAHLRSHQASSQDPLPRALHKCPSLFLCFASPAPNPSL